MPINKLVSAVLLGVCTPLLTSSSVEEGASKYFKTYLKDCINESFVCGVNQSRSDLNLGYSKVYGGYSYNEETLTNNKFVRVANFNSNTDFSNTTFNVCVTSLSATETIDFSFNYRFLEGKIKYNPTDVVFVIEFRGGKREITFQELDVSSKKDTGFDTFNGSLSILKTTLSNEFSITFNFKEAAALANPTTYVDIDEVKVMSNDVNYALKGDMESLLVDDTATLVSNIDLVNDPRDAYDTLLLNEEEINNFDQNSSYENKVDKGLTYTPYYQQLPRGSSTTSPLGLSATAGYTNVYQIYSPEEDNSFVRIKNFDGSNVNQTTIYNYYYDNENETAKNMPSTCFIYFSFSYRLFMSEEQQQKYVGSSAPVMFLSSRNASSNYSGYLNLDNFIINETGDDTWRHLEGIVDVRSTTSTNNIAIIIYHRSEMGSDEFCLDIDKFTLSNEYQGPNYFYGDGEFDFDHEANYHPLGENNNVLFKNVDHNTSKGSLPTAHDFGMSLSTGSTFSYLLDSYLPQGMYRIELTGTGDLENMEIAFDGSGGDRYDLSIKDGYSAYYKTDNSIIIYASSSYDFTYIQFIFKGLEALIYNLKIDLVSAVNVVGGDYSTFVEAAEALFDSIDISNLKVASVRAYKLLEKEYLTFNMHSSQARMDDFINRLTIFIQNTMQLKANLAELNLVIQEGLDMHAHLEQYTYTFAMYFEFDLALREALSITEEDTQERVDAVTLRLRNAINAMKGEMN